MIAQYLAPNGFVVSLQNCMNEETVDGVSVGKTVGCIAPSMAVELCEPGDVRRAAGRGGGKGRVVVGVGEVEEGADRAEQVRKLGGLCGWLAGDE